jgi:GDP-4-dehydro-6-deoxy-D-mannose reductase
MTRPTLITGAAGFAGSHLVDLLSSRGDAIVGWHKPGGTAPHGPSGVRWQAIDMMDRDGVRDAIRELQPAHVYHCAGAAHVGQAWDAATRTLAVNVLGTHHLIEALRERAPDARVLLPSSGLVYEASNEPLHEGHPLAPSSPYGLSKLAQELVGQNNGDRPPVAIARPFNHVGPRQDASFVAAGIARSIAEIEAGLRPPTLGMGNLAPRRDLTDVRDTVRAYVLILERGTPGRPYNVSSGRALAIRELVDMMLAKARRPIAIETDPAKFRPNDWPLVLGDSTRLRTELGWTPSIPIEQTVDDLLGYWRQRISAR